MSVRGGEWWSLLGSYIGHAYALIMVTERLGLRLFTALHVCWEYPSLVVSRAVFHFLCNFYEATTYFMPGTTLITQYI